MEYLTPSNSKVETKTWLEREMRYIYMEEIFIFLQLFNHTSSGDKIEILEKLLSLLSLLFVISNYLVILDYFANENVA